MPRTDFLKECLVSQVEPQGCHRDITSFDRPPVCVFFSLLDRDHREPEVRTAHRVFGWNYFPVVVPHRLPRPQDAGWHGRGQVDIDEDELGCRHEQAQNFRYPRLQQLEVRLGVGTGGAECDATEAEQRRLLGARQSTGMPNGVAYIASEVDTG